ncbi:2-haloalkanoic acid dehalogenase (EC [Amycolatopsis camponoti]|uniref:2-haloalkanoic acid dehalogenase (EC) n=1 Tax=Amycolatopsis camponoti TaxID=2606593 RepID=A0A6I8M8T6_9PSEU|nr:haloacid dehalogenase type II [Amycolatopsis camponoti]VVJ23991.1 2-haloalkanoic acid dehalogenase (EC [Amycolatopsis camponoti]
MLCVFDVNETLLDLSAMDPLIGGPALRREWFGLAIHTVLTVTATGGYRDFAGIAGEAATEVAARHGHAVDLAEIGEGLRHLPAHPDAEAGLAKLREAGHDVVALTNSPLATAEAQLQNSGLAKLFDRIFSAEQAGRLKPAPEPYRQVLDAYSVEGRNAVMIAAHDWDIAGAQAAGLRTALLARPGVRPLPGSPEPTYTISSLTELAGVL